MDAHGSPRLEATATPDVPSMVVTLTNLSTTLFRLLAMTLDLLARCGVRRGVLVCLVVASLSPILI